MADEDPNAPPVDPGTPTPPDPAPAPVETLAPDTTDLAPAPAADPTIDPAPAAADKPDARQTPWYMKRIGEQTGKLTEAQTRIQTQAAEIDALKRAFAALSPGQSAPAVATPATPVPAAPAPNQDFEARVAAETVRRAAIQAFNERCDKSFEDGQAAHADFKEAVDTLNAAGAMSSELIEAALETGVAHEVLYRLGKDPDQAVKLSKMSPVKLAMEIGKLAGEVQKPAPARPISQAPAPIVPVNGTARGGFDVADTTTPVDAWIAKREKEVSARREARGR